MNKLMEHIAKHGAVAVWGGATGAGQTWFTIQAMDESGLKLLTDEETDEPITLAEGPKLEELL